jgi:tetratricopeptide (TPR) repeat protein
MQWTVKQVLELLTRQRLVAAGVWNTFGQSVLSKVSCELALSEDHLWSHDRAVAVQNIARSALYGSSFEPTKGMQEVSGGCIYADAMRLLLSLKRQYQVEDALLFETGLLLHEWAVRRGDYAHAEALIVALKNNLCPRNASIEVRGDVLSQQSLLFARQGRFGQAKSIMRKLLDECDEEKKSTIRAGLLLQLAMMELESSTKTFTSSLASLLECLEMAEKLHMDSLHAAALSVLGQILLRMRKPKKGIAVILAALPTIMQHEHVFLQGEAYLTLARCYLQLAKDAEAGRKEYLKHAIKQLGLSEGFFSRCQDFVRLQEVYYLRAKTYDNLSDSVKRNEASARFLRLSKYLSETNHPRNDGFVECLGAAKSLLERLASRSIPVDA